MRTFEEVQADINSLKTEIQEIASAKAAAVAGDHVADLLRQGMHSVEMAFRDNPCSPSYRRLVITKVGDAVTVSITAGGSEARFAYDLSGGFVPYSLPRVETGKYTAMEVLAAWDQIAESEAAEREKDRAEVQFEIARGQERDDRDMPQPVYEGKGATPDDENGPDPFEDA